MKGTWFIECGSVNIPFIGRFPDAKKLALEISEQEDDAATITDGGFIVVTVLASATRDRE